MSSPSEDRAQMDFVEKLAAEFERAAASTRRMSRRERPLAMLARHRRVALVIALVVLACAAATVIAMNATARRGLRRRYDRLAARESLSPAAALHPEWRAQLAAGSSAGQCHGSGDSGGRRGLPRRQRRRDLESHSP